MLHQQNIEEDTPITASNLNKMQNYILGDLKQ